MCACSCRTNFLNESHVGVNMIVNMHAAPYYDHMSTCIHPFACMHFPCSVICQCVCMCWYSCNCKILYMLACAYMFICMNVCTPFHGGIYLHAQMQSVSVSVLCWCVCTCLHSGIFQVQSSINSHVCSYANSFWVLKCRRSFTSSHMCKFWVMSSGSITVSIYT